MRTNQSNEFEVQLYPAEYRYPAESDVTRGERQQQVMQALLSKMSGPGMFFRLPFVGGDLLKPITTDLSENDFLQLGWIKFRAGSVLHCRLGGTDQGGGYLTSSEDNLNVIQMVQGNSAPLFFPTASASEVTGLTCTRLPEETITSIFPPCHSRFR